MTFTQPWWLLLLTVVAGFTVYVQRAVHRPRGAVLRYPSAELLTDLVIPAPRRLVPVYGAAIAAALIVVAAAGPHAAILTRTERANVVLVVDVSGSMSATDVAPSRLDVARATAARFVETLPQRWRIGLVAFSATPVVVAAPTTDRYVVIDGLDALNADGGTATGDAINLAIDVGRAGGPERLEDARRLGDALPRPSRTVLVLISDGRQTLGAVDTETAAERAARLGIPGFTVAYGTSDASIELLYPDGTARTMDVPPDFETSLRIAAVTGGRAFSAVTASELTSVYSSVNAVLEDETRDVDLAPYTILVAAVIGAWSALTATRRRPRP